MKGSQELWSEKAETKTKLTTVAISHNMPQTPIDTASL